MTSQTDEEKRVATKIVVLGPSAAGKTGLLASLQVATTNTYSFDRFSDNVTVQPESDDAIALLGQTPQTVWEGHLPFMANDEVQEYSFTVKAPKYFLGMPWFKSWPAPARFHMWDPPGGHLFPLRRDIHQADIERSRKRIVEALRVADGFLICVSSVAPKESKDRFRFFANLGGLFNETRTLTLPARRVVIAITKTDHLVQRDHGGRLKQRRGATDVNAAVHETLGSPITYARQLLSNSVLKTVKKRLDPATDVGFCFTSAYGFLEGDMVANYDSNTDGMLTRYTEDGQVIDKDSVSIDTWRPFGVLAPFVFLAGGSCQGIHVIKARAL